MTLSQKTVKYQKMELSNLQKQVVEVAKKQEVLILAHSYQPIEIQQVADFVGDSLELSRTALGSSYQKIMFSAVKFMAETASIMSPSKKIMIAEPDAGCPLANMINAEDVLELRKKHPGAPVVCYINSTAQVKAVSDIICTSANALKICNSMAENELIFVPDCGLGGWIAEQTTKKIHLYPGFCPTHWLIDPEEIREVKKENPGALLVVHPESNKQVRDLADKVVGTSGMVKYVSENLGKTFIIGTEQGMVDRLKTLFPNEKFILASPKYLCPNMKKNTLEKLLKAIQNETTVVKVEKEIIDKARRAIERMYDKTA